MKKCNLIILLFLFLSFSDKGYTQQLPIYSQYMFNDYLINAAYAGTYYFSPIVVNHRNQWIGFGDSAPQTSSISIHGGVGKKSALGTSIIHDQTNPISQTQMELSYAYHAILNKRGNIGLSMALSGTYNMRQYTNAENSTYSEIMNGEIDNVSLENDLESISDINFGIILFNNNFDIGLSVRNLLAPENTDTDIDNEIDRVKYILVHGSYLGFRNENSPIALIPSFVIRKMGLYTYNSLLELDFNMKFVYRNKIWTGLSYRSHEKAISTLVGFNTPKAFFGWSYDIGMSELGKYHNGSHNIAVGLKITGKKKRKIRNQTPFYLDIDTERKKLSIPNIRHKSAI